MFYQHTIIIGNMKALKLEKLRHNLELSAERGETFNYIKNNQRKDIFMRKERTYL